MDKTSESKKASGKAYETLAAWIGGQCLPHAILAEGPAENANMAFALRAAKAAMCTGDDAPLLSNAHTEKPCGVCRDCVKLEKGVHPDLSVYEGDGRARSFHIETVREIRSKAFIYPNEAPVKVFILKNAQNMTVQAQNALLKILEEPPGSVIFILTCENKSALLETVLSRVSAVFLESGGEEDESSFSADNNDVEPDTIANNGVVANNGVSAQKNAAAECGVSALHLLLSSNELDALAAFSRYERDRSGFLEALSHMRRSLEDMLLPGRTADIASSLVPLRLLRIIDIIDDISFSAGGNGNISLLSSVLCARIRSVVSKG